MSTPFIPADDQERAILGVLIVGPSTIDYLQNLIGQHPEPFITAMGKRGLILDVSNGAVSLADDDVRRVTDGLCL